MKFSFFSIIMLTMFSFLEMNCAPQKEIQISNEEQPIITFSKGRCRGYCPTFTIDFFEPNKIRYNGEANMDVLGEKIYTISKKDMAKLKGVFEEKDFKNFKNEYLIKNIMDIPKATLSYDGHAILYHEREVPKEVKFLSELVEKYIPKK